MTETERGVAGLGVRLANIRRNGAAAPVLGAEVAGGVLDVPATAARLGVAVPTDTDALLRDGAAGAAAVRAVLDAAARDPEVGVVAPLAEARFAPAVGRPEKILCVGFNYREHAKETGTPIPEAPPLFSKFNNALAGHGDVVELPARVATQFDFETELVVVFGRECRDVAEADALDVVAGYAVGNDLSARDLQFRTSQFLAGKTSDGFAPLGPWLVPAGMVPDPNALALRTTVNGVARQDWSTRDMIFPCRALISFISGIMTIRPGDILFTGTPQGVILGEPGPREERRWLRAGDAVVSEIEGLGSLEVTLG